MKRSYIPPQMTFHGTLTSLTQITGNRSTTDSLIFNGNVVLTNDDSRDVVCDGAGTCVEK